MFPIIFQSQYFTIHSLWLFIAIAIIAGTYSLIQLSLKNGLKLQFLTENIAQLLFFSIIGARIMAILVNWQSFFYEYSTDTFLQIFKIWDKGLSAWGGVLIGLITLYFLCKKNDQDFLKWMDSIVPAFLIGTAIASLGLFLDGAQYGNETSLPWGVNFESPAIKYTVPIHPTQIYMLLYSSLIATGMTVFRDHKFFEKAGSLATLGIMAFSLFQFLQEFVKGDDVTMIFGVRFPMIITVLIFIASTAFYFYNYKQIWKR
jgi:phosphatidylglycerol---prolipoprotein diacylglyceryl transferase